MIITDGNIFLCPTTLFGNINPLKYPKELAPSKKIITFSKNRLNRILSLNVKRLDNYFLITLRLSHIFNIIITVFSGK